MDNCFEGCTDCDHELCLEETTTEEPTNEPTTALTTEPTTEPTTAPIPEGEEILIFADFFQRSRDPVILQNLPFQGISYS